MSLLSPYILHVGVITGIYVRRANAEYDTLTAEIIREARQ